MTDTLLYRLEGNKEVLCSGYQEWREWFDTADRTILFTETGNGDVSTVFTGITRVSAKVPLFYETMVWGGPYDEERLSYASREEAVQIHARVSRYLSHFEQVIEPVCSIASLYDSGTELPKILQPPDVDMPRRIRIR